MLGVPPNRRHGGVCDWFDRRLEKGLQYLIFWERMVLLLQGTEKNGGFNGGLNGGCPTKLGIAWCFNQQNGWLDSRGVPTKVLRDFNGCHGGSQGFLPTQPWFWGRVTNKRLSYLSLLLVFSTTFGILLADVATDRHMGVALGPSNRRLKPNSFEASGEIFIG